MKYNWTYEDDFTCCKEYLIFVFGRMTCDSLQDLVKRLEKLLPHIPSGSLRMKAQNIKALALDEGLEDHLEFSPLANYSRQCKRAFSDAVCALEAEGRFEKR